MSEFDKLSSYVERPDLAKDTDFILAEFKRVEDGAGAMAAKIASAMGSFNVPGGSGGGGGGKAGGGTKVFIDGMKDMELTAANYAKVLASVAAQVDNLTDVQKAQLKQINEQFKVEEQYRSGAKETVKLIATEVGQIAKKEAAMSDMAMTIARNNAQLAAQTRENKLNAAVLEAERNSLSRANALILQYTDAKKKLNLSTEDGRRLNESYNKAIEKTNNFILKNADVETKRTKNIGNYNKAATLVIQAMEKEKSKLDQLTKSMGANHAATEATKKSVDALQAVLDQPAFLKVASKVGDATAELKFFTKALVDMEANQQGNSEAAVALRKHLAELTDQIADARADIKALSSDTRSFDLFAGSVSAAADAMQTAAGISAIFGASEEETAEAIKNVVAIQAIANGVKGIANELTTRGTAANKLYAFSQAQIKTAMDATATAGARLRAILITLGIGAIVVGIGLLIANYEKIKRAVTGVSEVQEKLNETQEAYTKGTQEAIEKTTKVKAAFDLAAKGVITKKDALKTYNEELGDNLGKAKSLEEAERLYAAKAPAYVEIMGLKAKANAKFALSAEYAAKAVDAGNKDQVGAFQKLKAAVLGSVFGYGVEVATMVDAQIAGTKKAQKAATDASDAIYQDGLKDLTRMEELSKQFKVEGTPDKEEKKEKKNDDSLKNAVDKAQKEADAVRAIVIEKANERVRAESRVLEDSFGANFERQLAAIDEIDTQKKKIAAVELAQAVESELEVQDGKIKVIKKSQKEIELANLVHQNKLNAINDETLAAQVAARKAQTEKLKEQFEKQREAELKILDDGQADVRRNLEIEYNENVTALNKKFVAGKISKEKYDKEMARLTLDYQLKSLQAEIEYQRKLIALQKLSPEARKKALADLAKFEKELSDASAKNKQQNDTDTTNAMVKNLEKVKEVGELVASVLSGITNINSINRKNQLQEESDLVEKNAAREIEIVNASLASEQDKAARIAIINARAASQKEAIARKDRQINIDNARMEKALTIFNIILTNALNIAKAAGNPFKLAMAIATGAVQLGIAIATPIPKFATGLDHDYEGPAWVGDGGKREAKISKDGKVTITPNKPTLDFIKKGDRIHPDADEFMADLQRASMRDVARGVKGPAAVTENGYGAAMSEALAQNANRIVEAIANQPRNHQAAKEGALVSVWKHGANMTKYFNENTQWVS